MKIVCKECKGKARIGSRQELSLEFAKLYCLCLDCGHRFVMNLTYSHATCPPAGTIEQLLFNQLRDMPRAQQRQLFDQLGAASA